MNKPKKISRRTVLGLGGAGLVGYSIRHPYSLTVKRYQMSLEGLAAPLKVVQLTDLHYGPWIHEGSVARWVNQTLALKPDLIVVTGDIVDRKHVSFQEPLNGMVKPIEPLIAQLERLTAPLGVGVVWGNHDYRYPDRKAQLQAMCTRKGFHLLVNQAVVVRPDVQLLGVDDHLQGVPDYGALLNRVKQHKGANILLCHNPDYAVLEVAKLDKTLQPQLTLCGHTHGGQIRVPFVGAPWTPSHFGDQYAYGHYTQPVNMVVGCGLGVGGFAPLRVGTTPELVLLDLLPA